MGRRLRMGDLVKPPGSQARSPTNASPYLPIVGVIGNTLDDGGDGPQKLPQPAVLIPYTLLTPPGFSLAVRTVSEPKLLVNALRAQVRQMDKEQPVNGPETIEEILTSLSAQPRFTMLLFTMFS